ncbi:MAG TPA: glutathione S-transferase N-terminal domain-containing protein [Polyangiaceae bacterium]|nr:glutathione S-transferase N-terminal domain-containing protein [Polyangiaceae bacterium]
MTFVPTLYYSPGAVSLAAHFALEESGVPYRLEQISVKDGQQRSERYLDIHPLGRLPALELEPGVVLTETPALLGYIAELAPERALLPTSGLARARADEWLSLGATTLHVMFLCFFRPDRYTSDQAAQDALRADGKERFVRLLAHVDARLTPGGFALGADYSLVDASLAVFLLWARRFELPVASLQRYGVLTDRVLGRPAVQRALEQEGLAPRRS